MCATAWIQQFYNAFPATVSPLSALSSSYLSRLSASVVLIPKAASNPAVFFDSLCLSLSHCPINFFLLLLLVQVSLVPYTVPFRFPIGYTHVLKVNARYPQRMVLCLGLACLCIARMGAEFFPLLYTFLVQPIA